MRTTLISLVAAAACCACSSASGSGAADSAAVETPAAVVPAVEFNADSAYTYVARQLDFGPRVPNTEAHRQAAEWLAAELRRHGADVSLQKADLRAFDGTTLHATNIIGQFNPEATDRVLLVAHWDSRPWADADPDESRRREPVMGANDGASGVGVLLEMARLAGITTPSRGLDILFVDAEDWGDEGDDESWALGARYFTEHPFRPGYLPSEAIIVDMVGGENAVFPREFFSQQGAPGLVDRIWGVAHAAGYADRFPNRMGGAITDDHVQFLAAGIPAIDIIQYSEPTGFHPAWHTTGDTLAVISVPTLKAVGQTLANYLWPPVANDK